MIVGFGVVGQSFAKLLLSRSADLYSQYGIKPRIVACVDNNGSAISPAGLDVKRLLESKKTKGTVGAYERGNTKFDPLQVIEKVDAEVMLECTPTNLNDAEPATSHVTVAMRSHKHVICVKRVHLPSHFPHLSSLPTTIV